MVRLQHVRGAGGLVLCLLLLSCLTVTLGACRNFSKKSDKSLAFPYRSHSTDASLDAGILHAVLQPPVISGAQWTSSLDCGFAKIGSYALAGITSHHLLAAWYIDSFFADLAAQRKVAGIPIKTFVVLSPRHFEQGHELAAFSSLPWDTGLGSLSVDRSLANQFRLVAGSRWEPYSFVGEHGIGVPASFIKKHFPKAKMVPIVLEIAGLRMDVLHSLAEAIAVAMKKDKGLFLLVSSDFSHAEGLEITRQRDAQSAGALIKLNSVSARRVCCDNNAGMIILGMVLEELGRGESHIAAHTSGYEIVGIEENITSYFFCYF